MMLKLELTESEGARLLAFYQTVVKSIATGLARAGLVGLGEALTELRAVSGLIAKLEAAGAKIPRRTQEALEAAEEPETEADASPDEEAEEPEASEPGSNDAAPPAAVVAARRKASNGAKQAFRRRGGADTDAESGP